MKKKITFFVCLMGIALLFPVCKPPMQTAIIQKSPTVSPILYSTLYQQYAAEYRALCFQAYNIADFRLNEATRRASARPMAIVLDIDETILDNIPYEAEAIKGNFGYPEGWAEWMEQANAEPLAGAVDFLNRAKGLGVECFYVSNRKEIFKEATIQNLNEKGFPFADEAHVILRSSSNEKQTRRNEIAKKYDIIMLIGDNLGDFDGIFEEVSAKERMDAVNSNSRFFGSHWIVLPNAVYGNWVDVLPGYNSKLKEPELSDSLKQHLKGFRK
ncbi:MAG: 5'-nucleotidase, lipoprotein e(P4) family [Bacteroidales bacterium]|nr:5'-nucleotidase, lipoprotein e(P4) family [Bacteroidales bacterium]